MKGVSLTICRVHCFLGTRLTLRTTSLPFPLIYITPHPNFFKMYSLLDSQSSKWEWSPDLLGKAFGSWITCEKHHLFLTLWSRKSVKSFLPVCFWCGIWIFPWIPGLEDRSWTRFKDNCRREQKHGVSEEQLHWEARCWKVLTTDHVE